MPDPDARPAAEERSCARPSPPRSTCEQIWSPPSGGLAKPNNSPIYAGLVAYYGDRREAGLANTTRRRPSKLLQESGYKGEKITILANKRADRAQLQRRGRRAADAAGGRHQREIEVLEWATQLDRYNKGNYQMQAFSYSARFDPALGFEQFSGPKDKQPRKVWENPQALALIDKAMRSADKAERQPLFDDLHKRFIEEVPMIFTFNGIEPGPCPSASRASSPGSPSCACGKSRSPTEPAPTACNPKGEPCCVSH
jgi:peptide/nickel transport system substrate-binding protein